MSFERISIKEIDGFRFGNAEDQNGATGCTVIISDKGAVAGVDVRGGGPATRETDLLRSENTVESINAVVLSGGSAFGLEAGSGAMDFLEKHRIGFGMGDIVVPIVCQASLFDLGVGDPNVRPDKAMGIKACENAYDGIFEHGNHGAGTGASVGKFFGMDRAMKTGLGTYACSDGVLEVGAVTAVNAFADVYSNNNRILAGLLSEDKERLEGTIGCLKNNVHVDSPTRKMSDKATESDEPELDETELGYETPFNTTISCLVTNAKLTKPQANKLASVLHDGFARAIKPVHSSLDGDTIFVMSSGTVDVNFDAFAALATDIMQYSVIDGAISAPSAYGLKSAGNFSR